MNVTTSTGPLFRRLTGGSMRPLIRSGDVVCIEQEIPRFGDIVFYEKGGRPFAHRVICALRNNLITKGDALQETPHSIPKDNVRGTVTSIWKSDGRIVALGSSEARFKALVILCLSLAVTCCGRFARLISLKLVQRRTALVVLCLSSTLTYLSRLARAGNRQSN